MSITVSAVKARQNLGELLNIVSLRHEDVIIERAGKKIARLTTLEEDAVHEPVAEYRTRKSAQRPSLEKKIKPDSIDFSSIFGTWDDEEYQQVTEAVNSLRTIDPEMWS